MGPQIETRLRLIITLVTDRTNPYLTRNVALCSTYPAATQANDRKTCGLVFPLYKLSVYGGAVHAVIP